MLSVVVVVGNPKPLSRTRRVAELLVESLLVPGTYEMQVIDLADHVDQVFAWPSEEMAALSDAAASSDLLIVASPTYKATYTGLLKAFLDRYPANGLTGVTTIPVQTGADFTHAMGPTHTLAPLLAELGASVPGRGLYVALGQLEQLEDVVGRAAGEYAANLARLAHVASAVRVVGVSGSD